jgi:hypothetical protein
MFKIKIFPRASSRMGLQAQDAQDADIILRMLRMQI